MCNSMAQKGQSIYKYWCNAQGFVAMLQAFTHYFQCPKAYELWMYEASVMSTKGGRNVSLCKFYVAPV